MLVGRASTTVEFFNEKFRDPPHSVTLLRAKFDQWLADKVSEKGAFIISKNRVDDLIYDGTRVDGVKATDSELLSDCVVVADGVLSFIAERAKMSAVRDPHNYAVGVKELSNCPRRQSKIDLV